MIVGVPRESFPGERRVALVPAVIPMLAKAGLEVVVETGAGVEAGYPDAEYVNKGAKIVAQSRRGVSARPTSFCRSSATARTTRLARPTFRSCGAKQALIGFLRPLGDVQTVQEIAATGVTVLLRRADAAHHARAKHGRALLHGHHLRLQGGADRRRHAAPDLSHADHRGRNDHAVARVDHRLRGCRAAGHCHRPPIGRSGLGLRFAPAVKEQVQSLGGRFVELPIEAPTRRMPAATPRRRTNRSTRSSANCSARWSPRATS